MFDYEGFLICSIKLIYCFKMLYCPNAKNTPNKNVKLFKLSIEFGEGKNGIKCERKANGQRQAKERKAGKGKKYQERLCGLL